MIIFLSKNKVCKLLKSNIQYYRSFTELDKKARKIDSVEDYLSIISKDCCNFNQKQKIKLIRCCEEADELLRDFSITGFDGKKASRIKWKIGCLKGNRYEEGFPHTVKDTIILFNHILKLSYKNLVRLLIHEKVHVYQRKYKRDIEEYLYTNGFVHIYDRTDNNKIRANPDIDDRVFYCTKTRKRYEMEYRTMNPKSIDDTKSRNEHPFEEMAYKIEKYQKL